MNTLPKILSVAPAMRFCVSGRTIELLMPSGSRKTIDEYKAKNAYGRPARGARNPLLDGIDVDAWCADEHIHIRRKMVNGMWRPTGVYYDPEFFPPSTATC